MEREHFSKRSNINLWKPMQKNMKIDKIMIEARLDFCQSLINYV